MLVLTFDCDIPSAHIPELEAVLSEKLGEKCLVITMCTGVYRITPRDNSEENSTNHINDPAKVLSKQTQDKGYDGEQHLSK